MAYVVNGSSVEPRTVTVLRRGRDQIAIASGLREGEPVVVEGVFTLKSAIVKSTFAEEE